MTLFSPIPVTPRRAGLALCAPLAIGIGGALPALAQQDGSGVIALPQLEVAAEGASSLNLDRPSTAGSRLGLTPLETPGSVEILQGDAVRARGDLSVSDAVSRATGITSISSPGNGGTALSARGFTGHGSVMRLYDGIRLYAGAGTVTFPFDTWSVERIEVLRGPASVLYGEGAIGGAINVVSRQPNRTAITNEAELLFDTNLTRRFGLGSGGPVNDRLSYRIDISGDASEGWVDRGRTRNLAVHGVLRYDLTPELTLTLSHDYGDQNPMRYFGAPLANGSVDSRTRGQNYNVSNSIVRYQDNWTQLRLEWRPAESITVRNVGYRLASERQWRNAEAYGYQPGDTVRRSDFLEILHDQAQWGNRFDTTHRSRVLGMENTFLAGFDVNTIRFTHINNSPYGGSDIVPLLNTDPRRFINLAGTYPRYRTNTDQVSAFIENRLAITPRLSLVGGMRYDHASLERRDLVSGTVASKDFNASSWRVGAVYMPLPDLALYAQYATAVDPVGSLITLSPTQQQYELSTGRQWEVGIKQALWGGQAEWTFAAYDIVKDKLLSRDPANPNLTQQVGQQSSQGLELTLAATLGSGVRINANGTLLRARYDEFDEITSGGVVSRAGNVPINVPQQTANIWVNWAFAPQWEIQGGVRYVGKAFTDNANAQSRPSYTVFDLGLTWQPHPAVAVTARLLNLTDETYAVTTYNGQWLLGPPRTGVVAARVSF